MSSIRNVLQKTSSIPKIGILLGTYQGQIYLSQQLDSFFSQNFSNWTVWASDDGSQDGTCGILQSYRSRWGEERLSILSGPRKGFVANFLSLTCHPDIQADYYAYSDQDDIWVADKLQRAVDWLNTIPSDVPALYCTRTQLIDATGKHMGYSPLFTKPPSFANALVQSIGGGNTMVFNQAARNLLCEVGETVDVISHDWWVYLAVSACGGKVFYDDYPSLSYRQHNANLSGTNSGWAAKKTRANQLFKGFFRDWNNCNIKALQRLHSRMTPINREIFDSFVIARDSRLLSRLLGFRRAGIYRQTTLGNLGLIAAAVLKKI